MKPLPDVNLTQIAYERAMLVPRDMYAVEVRELLEDIITACAALPEADFEAEKLGTLLSLIAERRGDSAGRIAAPLLVALTGGTTSEEPARVISDLGKRITEERLAHAVSKLRDTA